MEIGFKKQTNIKSQHRIETVGANRTDVSIAHTTV